MKKRILSLLLMAALVLSLAISATASPTTPHTITIQNTEGGHTYEAYQIFKGDLVVEYKEFDLSAYKPVYQDNDNTKALLGYNASGLVADPLVYTVDGSNLKISGRNVAVKEGDKWFELDASGLKKTETKTLTNPVWGANIDVTSEIDGKTFVQALKAAFPSVAKVAALDNDATAREVVDALGDLASSHGPELADVISKYLTGTPVSTATNTAGGDYTLNVVGDGYYFIKDKDGTQTEKGVTDFILRVVENTTVKAKSDTPSIEKKILDVYNPDDGLLTQKKDNHGRAKYYLTDYYMPDEANEGQFVKITDAADLSKKDDAKTVVHNGQTYSVNGTDDVVTTAAETIEANNAVGPNTPIYVTADGRREFELRLDENTASVGEYVKYEIRAKVPAMEGYDWYFFVANDTLGKGLTYVSDAQHPTEVKIVAHTEGEHYLDKEILTLSETTDPEATGTVYQLTKGTSGEDTTLQFLFNNFIQYRDNHKVQLVKVTTSTQAYLSQGTANGAPIVTLPTYHLTDDTSLPSDLVAEFGTLPASADKKIVKTSRTGAEGDPYTVTTTTYELIEAPEREVVITYWAQVNNKAIIGSEGNPNKVNLEYSRDPNTKTNNKTNKPGDDDVTGKTPDDEVKTYVTELEILKVDEEGKPLTGAVFTIKGNHLVPVVKVSRQYTKWVEVVEEGVGTGKNAAGIAKPTGTAVYYKLTDDTYTNTAPNLDTYAKYGITLNLTGIADITVDPGKTEAETRLATEVAKLDVYYYEVVETIEYQSSPVEKDVAVNEDGKLYLGGIGAGEYTIKEKTAPTGYNLLEETLYVKVRFDPATNKFSAKYTDSVVPESSPWDDTTSAWTALSDGAMQIPVSVKVGEGGEAYEKTLAAGEYLSMNVVNKKGSTLPETGGIGTKIFYVLGSILVLGGGVLLITRKRIKNNKEDASAQ